MSGFGCREGREGISLYGFEGEDAIVCSLHGGEKFKTLYLGGVGGS